MISCMIIDDEAIAMATVVLHLHIYGDACENSLFRKKREDMEWAMHAPWGCDTSLIHLYYLLLYI